MNYGHFFEAVMLVCFGFSWPLNVVKAYKARTAKGTSLGFIILIITGYLAGITAKFVNHQLNYVLVVYFLNLAIVFTNLIVYFRNVSLDKKESKIMKYDELNEIAEKNAVVLFGSTLDAQIPVTELAQSFDFNFKLYNRSEENLVLKEAQSVFEKNILPMEPEGVIIHLGEDDVNMFMNNSNEFDSCYLSLIAGIKKANSKCRIALVSVKNDDENFEKAVGAMNRHIRAIADSEKCAFVNLDNVKVWNPKATKAAVNFAYSMGLNVRKPLLDVAEILYSYAYTEMKAKKNSAIIAG